MRRDGSPRILVMRLDNIGDVVMTGPALRALREHWPRSHITLMVSPAGGRAAPLLPWIDAVWTERVAWQDAHGAMPQDRAREQALIERLWDGRFDIAVVLTSFSQSPFAAAYACYLAGIPVRAGQARDFGGALLTHIAPALPDAAHQVERNLHTLSAFGVHAADRSLALSIPTSARERARRLLGTAASRPYVLIAPGASCSARRYAPERFGRAARAIATTAGYDVVVTGSERERALVAEVIAHCPGAKALDDETGIPELAAVIEGAALVVCNDSAPMHIADALRRPMVVLYSGTELESQWRPRAARGVLLRRPTACAPCHRFDCPHGLPCLDVGPSEVADAALALLRAGVDRARVA